MVKGLPLSTGNLGEMNSTSLELSFKSHFVCLYMYVCNHVRTLIVQINMFKPSTGNLPRGGLPRNSVERITDRPGMASAVDRGRKKKFIP